MRMIPPQVLTASPLDAEDIVPTLYDPEEFAALYHADKDCAITLVTAMAEPQRVRQALAYCAWLGCHGLEIDLATVLAAWEREGGVRQDEPCCSAQCAEQQRRVWSAAACPAADA